VPAQSEIAIPLSGINATEGTFTFRLHGTGNDLAVVTVGNFAVASNGPAWQNSSNHLDVDKNGLVQPLDALIIINDLNSNGSRQLPGLSSPPTYYLDVNGDGYAAPLDALQIINYLNSPSAQNAQSPVVSKSALAADTNFISTDVSSLSTQFGIARPWTISVPSVSMRPVPPAALQIAAISTAEFPPGTPVLQKTVRSQRRSVSAATDAVLLDFEFPVDSPLAWRVASPVKCSRLNARDLAAGDSSWG
jgi:hypothetical protein